MVVCSSGKHGWIDPGDAERCCNGWHRVLERQEGPRGRAYRFIWVPDEEGVDAAGQERSVGSDVGGLEGSDGQARTKMPVVPSGADALLLTIELVPRPLWGHSLAHLMPRTEWDRLRQRIKALSSYRCAICGAAGRLFCHEVWHYDDRQHVQSLGGFQAICALCHHVKHLGHAGILAFRGELDIEEVVQHFLRVNGCSRETFEQHTAYATQVWRERSRHQWTTDFGEYAGSIHPRQADRSDRGDRGAPTDAEQPSTYAAQYWIYAERQQGSYPQATERNGKWMLFPLVADVDTWWTIIKRATEEGRLGAAAKVATARPNPRATNTSERLICVYTYDGFDEGDVMRVREALRNLGVTWPISYKLDSDTLAGRYAATGAKVSLYRV